MTIAVEVTFPWGMYHATAWGRHVNEGEVDWPPAPWRLLRALYCTWRERAPELPAYTVQPLLAALASPPAYKLPPHVPSSTRHYYPDTAKGTDRVIDAFMALDRDATLRVQWDTDLPDDQRAALARLVELLPYLGRAESICSARLVNGDASLAGDGWLEPAERAEAETIGLLAADPPLDFASLTETTDQMRSAGRLRPLGARPVPYGRVPAAETAPVRRRRPPVRPAAVRWAISSPALPSVHLSAAIGESMRRQAMSRYGALFGGEASAVLSGKDATGSLLRGHGHAHYLPFDEDGDGLLDHVLVWAPGVDGNGIDQQAVQTLTAINRVFGPWSGKETKELRLAVEAVGPAAAMAPSLCGPSTRWESRTPFAPPRHWNRKANDPKPDFVPRSVIKAWRQRSSEQSVTDVEDLPHRDWLAFRRHRLNERLEDARRALGLRITFDAPVEGPVCLGSLSHFGLGLFAPAPA